MILLDEEAKRRKEEIDREFEDLVQSGEYKPPLVEAVRRLEEERHWVVGISFENRFIILNTFKKIFYKIDFLKTSYLTLIRLPLSIAPTLEEVQNEFDLHRKKKGGNLFSESFKQKYAIDTSYSYIISFENMSEEEVFMFFLEADKRKCFNKDKILDYWLSFIREKK